MRVPTTDERIQYTDSPRRVALAGNLPVAPGALALVQIGKGLLVLDQLLREKGNVRQERSGQYTAILPDSLARCRPGDERSDESRPSTAEGDDGCR